MGNRLSQLFADIGLGKKEMRIVMVGLDAAGKTTILYKMKIGETGIYSAEHCIETYLTLKQVHTIPTIGFNVETIQYRKVNLTVWDIGGQDKIRRLWRHYYYGTHGIIFVVDSSDRERISEAQDELTAILKTEELRDTVLLVYANKQDLPNAMSPMEITEKLGLHDVRHHDWHVQGACATYGEGLENGLEWMTRALKKRF